jgi:hypothetical protein
MLDMGHIEQSIAKQAMRSGQPLPDRIANAPELRTGLELYLQAFFDLDSERSHATSPTAISWSSVRNYAETFEFDEEQTENIHYFIREMDSENLKRIANKMKSG